MRKSLLLVCKGKFGFHMNQVRMPLLPSSKLIKCQVNVVEGLSMTMLTIQHGCNLSIQFILLCLHGYHLNWHSSKYILFQIINTTILNHIIVHLHKIDVFAIVTPFWGKCEVATHTPENGTWESSGTLKNSKHDFRSQNTSHWGVLYIIVKFLKCKCPKWPRMNHLDICSTSYSRKKGWESN